MNRALAWLVILYFMALPLAYAADYEYQQSDSLPLTDPAYCDPTNWLVILQGGCPANYLKVTILSIVTETASDALSLSDSRLVTITTPTPQGQTPTYPSLNSPSRYLSNQNVGGNSQFALLFSGVLMPFGIITGIMLVGVLIGLRGKPIIAIGVLCFGALAWLGILPGWITILLIIFGAFAIALIMSKLIGQEQD